jgi:hypothetical protein
MKKKKIEGLLEEETNLPPDVKLHENGILYKEIFFDGLDKPVKLFNTLKPQRLEDETQMEYKMRRQIQKMNEKEKKRNPEVFYNPYENSYKGIPYVNKNKKDKFKKKK